jgi:hypothetical protein
MGHDCLAAVAVTKKSVCPPHCHRGSGPQPAVVMPPLLPIERSMASRDILTPAIQPLPDRPGPAPEGEPSPVRIGSSWR